MKGSPATLSMSGKRRNPLWITLRALVRTRVTTGLILVLPIWICVVLVRFIFGVMRDASMWLVEAVLLSSWGLTVLETWNVPVADLQARGLAALPLAFQWTLSIFCVLLTVFLLYVLGLLAANLVGRRLIDRFENLVNRVPLLKTVYNSAKQVLIMLGGERRQRFNRVALVPWPHEGTRRVGFVTSSFADALTGEELCAVFVPSTPNPTSGFTQIFRKTDVTEVPWSVEEAMSYIIGAGIIVPQGLVTMQLNSAGGATLMGGRGRLAESSADVASVA